VSAPVSFLRKCAAVLAGFGLLLAGGCEKSETSTQPAETPAPAVPAASPIPKPATPNSFAEVTAQLDPGGDFYLYLSTAQWLGKLSQSIDNLRDLLLSGSDGQPVADRQQAEQIFTLLKDVVQKSGLEQITGLGASSFEVSHGLFRNKVFVHHYPGQDAGLLWTLYGRPVPPGAQDPNLQIYPLTNLDLLPVDTALATYGNFDFNGFVEFLIHEADQSGIPELKQDAAQWQTQFSGVTGLKLDDVLGSLNGSLGMVLTLDATSTISIPAGQQPLAVPAPRLALLIAVHNDLIFNQIDKMAGGNPGVVKVDEPDLKMRTMPLPMIPGLNLRPTVASWGGFLIIASDDKLIRDMIATRKGTPGYKSTPEYALLSAGLPTQGNGFAVMSQHLVDTVRKLQGQSLVDIHGSNTAAQAALMQRMLSSGYENAGHFMVIYSLLPNGWLSVGQGSQGSSQMLAPLAIFPAAIGAGALIPAFSGIHSRPYHATTPPSNTLPGPPPIPAPTP
jgi:hypothetical protein